MTGKMMSVWKGPEVDGITQSILNDWLGCPYSAYIKLILCLQEDTPPHPNLIWGDCYHVGLEHLIKDRDVAKATKKMLERLSTYPQAAPSYKYSLPRMLRLYALKSHMAGQWTTEQQLDKKIDIDGRLVRFRGKIDGINITHPEYGRLLVEHKCKGYIDPVLTKEELDQDLQCNLYMNIMDTEWVAYDLIKIPDVQKYGPNLGYNETPEEWINRLYQGPIGTYGNKYPIYRFKEKWIHQGIYFIGKEQQTRYWNETIIPLVKRICLWYDHVTSPSFSLEDPKCYNELFYRAPIRHFNGRNTESFKCSYHGIHTNQLELSDLIPIKSHFAELEEQ